VTFGVDGTREEDGMFSRGVFFKRFSKINKNDLLYTLILILLLGWNNQVFLFQLINLNVNRAPQYPPTIVGITTHF